MPNKEPKQEVTHEEMQIIRARLGIEAESFERSHVGEYINLRIETDLDKFQQELIDTDPHDVEKCVDIRNHILVRKLFTLWIKEAISSGLNAHQELKDEDQKTY